MAIKEELAGISGAENVLDDADSLKAYSKDNSLSTPGMPSYVVKPKNAAEIQGIIELANETSIPLLRSSFATTKFIHLFTMYVEDRFAPRIMGASDGQWSGTECCL